MSRRGAASVAVRPALAKLHRPDGNESIDWGWGVLKNVGGALAVCAALLAGSAHVWADEDFPIIGTYAKDQTCKGDGSDPADLLVKITGKSVESNMGICTILSRKRSGKVFSVQVECKAPGNQVILGDVTFTLRDDSALDFDDQDHTSPAVLYKCGK
jgi:hypothetical protein